MHVLNSSPTVNQLSLSHVNIMYINSTNCCFLLINLGLFMSVTLYSCLKGHNIWAIWTGFIQLRLNYFLILSMRFVSKWSKPCLLLCIVVPYIFHYSYLFIKNIKYYCILCMLICQYLFIMRMKYETIHPFDKSSSQRKLG